MRRSLRKRGGGGWALSERSFGGGRGRKLVVVLLDGCRPAMRPAGGLRAHMLGCGVLLVALRIRRLARAFTAGIVQEEMFMFAIQDCSSFQASRHWGKPKIAPAKRRTIYLLVSLLSSSRILFPLMKTPSHISRGTREERSFASSEHDYTYHHTSATQWRDYQSLPACTEPSSPSPILKHWRRNQPTSLPAPKEPLDRIQPSQYIPAPHLPIYGKSSGYHLK